MQIKAVIEPMVVPAKTSEGGAEWHLSLRQQHPVKTENKLKYPDMHEHD